MAGSGFDFQKLIEDSKNVLVSPKSYFASMAKEGGLGEPIIKALIYGIVAGVINFIWGLLHISSASMTGGMFGAGAGGIMILIWSIIGAIIGLFIGGIIILIISAICGGNTNFEANVRVSASIMVLMPVGAILGILGAVGFTLSALVSLAVSLYGLFLLYHALVNALQAKEGTAKIVTIVLAIIPVLMLISSLVCVSAVGRYGDRMIKGLPDDKQIEELKDKVKELQEMQEKSE